MFSRKQDANQDKYYRGRVVSFDSRTGRGIIKPDYPFDNQQGGQFTVVHINEDYPPPRTLKPGQIISFKPVWINHQFNDPDEDGRTGYELWASKISIVDRRPYIAFGAAAGLFTGYFAAPLLSAALVGTLPLAPVVGALAIPLLVAAAAITLTKPLSDIRAGMLGLAGGFALGALANSL